MSEALEAAARAYAAAKRRGPYLAGGGVMSGTYGETNRRRINEHAKELDRLLHRLGRTAVEAFPER